MKMSSSFIELEPKGKPLLKSVGPLEKGCGEDGRIFELMGYGKVIERINREIELVAKTDFTVILQGETGTGKEIVARAIHSRGRRNNAQFIAMDCGAIPETLMESELYGYEKGAFTGAVARKEGHFELATAGTLYLDEITNLRWDSQCKFLRALEEKKIRPLGSMKLFPVDTRVIVSTNIDLMEEVEKGRFRRDLYHRLNEYSIYLPPLKERREDIPHLIRLFMREANKELGKRVKSIKEKALEILMAYEYPGNVRELRNLIRRAVLVSGEMIGPECFFHLKAGRNSSFNNFDLAEALRSGCSFKDLMDQITQKFEREAVEIALKESGYNKTRAARFLKVDRKTLYKKMGASGSNHSQRASKLMGKIYL